MQNLISGVCSKVTVTQGSHSNGSEGQMRTNKVTRGPHYDVDATMVIPDRY